MADHIAGPLYWERLGRSGRPMVFVHPNPLDHSCWVYQMDHFSTWYRCIGVDLPGYGKSPRAEPGLTIADMAQACWEAVDETSREPAILVGLSVGWHIAVHMAHQRPEQASAILLSGCSYHGSEPRPYTAANAAAYGERGIEARQGHIFNDWSRTFRETEMGRYFARILVERNRWADAPSIVQIFHALSSPDPEVIFDELKAPVLIITGSEDSSHQGAFALQKRIRGCELVTMQGAGHACNMERPWEWDRHAIDFLARHGLFDGE